MIVRIAVARSAGVFNMAVSRSSKRRAAGVASAKILITSASVAATIGGWAAISAAPQAVAGAANSPAMENQPAPQFGAPDGSQAPSTARPWLGGRRRRHFGQNGSAPFGQPAPSFPNGGTQIPDQQNPGVQTIPAQPRQPVARTHSSR